MTDFVHFSLETDERLFVCSETGETGMPDKSVHRYDELRERCGFPLIATSGYRSPRHSKEASKDKPGEHTRGAADWKIGNGYKRYILVREAMKMGFTGIGIAKTFVHTDDRTSGSDIWTY